MSPVSIFGDATTRAQKVFERHWQSSGTIEVVVKIAAVCVTSATVLGITWHVLRDGTWLETIHCFLDPRLKEKLRTQIAARNNLKSIRAPDDLALNEEEKVIANQIVPPGHVQDTFDDVGGHDNIIRGLDDAIMAPLRYYAAFGAANSLFAPTKGVLLYGPPGCGKTMLARAVANKAGATFINVTSSTVQSKYFGDSPRLARALFSLARKLQPTIIFIDEIDSLLRERERIDHEASNTVKAEFMIHWDGLQHSNERILVLGATNRPESVDDAILRRMPKRFFVGMPNQTARLAILELLLRDIVLDPHLDLARLARDTAGKTGSDLKEACRAAVQRPICEAIAAKEAQMGLTGHVRLEAFGEGMAEQNIKYDIRPLRQSDFDIGMQGVKLDSPGLASTFSPETLE